MKFKYNNILFELFVSLTILLFIKLYLYVCYINKPNFLLNLILFEFNSFIR